MHCSHTMHKELGRNPQLKSYQGSRTSEALLQEQDGTLDEDRVNVRNVTYNYRRKQRREALDAMILEKRRFITDYF